jgi:uncharacterized protein YndB with AHSA1/START domain
MSEASVIHHTFVLERSYPVAPERVFAAFSDPALKRRWFVEGDHHTVEHYELDFRVGGCERASLRFGPGTPIAGALCSNEQRHLDIVPAGRIVSASTMAINGRPISASLCTFEFRPSAAGCDLVFTHQAAFFEHSDGPAMREAGWRAIFDRLTAALAD